MRDYDFGNLVHELRKKKGLTQSELGNILGVSNKTISKWETGATKPSVKVLYKMADFFEVSPDELVSGKINAKIEKKESVFNRVKDFLINNKKKIAKTVLIVLAVLVLSAGIFLGIYYNLPIIVPDVEGKTVEAAISVLEEHDFNTNVTYEYSDTVKKGFVISTNAAAGEKLKRNSVIEIKASLGVELFEVPSVKNFTLDQAEKTITESGFLFEYTQEYSDTVEKGLVISQNIQPQAKVYKGTRIKVVISKGVDLVEVPNVVGETLESALELLNANDFTVIKDIKCSDAVKEGFVISQDINAGEMIRRESEVRIVVSAGVSNKKGNTNSNAVNFGFVASQGDWVYYSNNDYNYYLYKMRSDGSEKQILSTDHVLQINVVGEWIYYTSEKRESSGVYKIRLDGEKKTKLSSRRFYWMMVIEDEIYYVESFNGGPLCKMNTDGTGKVILSDHICDYVNIIGDWIYYIDSSTHRVYKVTTEGKGRTVVNSAVWFNNIRGEDDYLFGDTLEELCRIKAGSSECIFYNTPDNRQRSFLNYHDGWVYYVEHDFSTKGNPKSAFYKMKPDTSNATKILDITFKNTPNYYLNMAGDWIYFPNDDDNSYMYRVKTDGSNLQKVYN